VNLPLIQVARGCAVAYGGDKIHCFNPRLDLELTFLCTNASSVMHPSAAFLCATSLRQAVVREPPVYTADLFDVFWRFPRPSSFSFKCGGRNTEYSRCKPSTHAASWLFLSLPLLLSVAMVDVSLLLFDRQYTELSGLGALARVANPVCPWHRFSFASLDLRLLAGMVCWSIWGMESCTVYEHTKFKNNFRYNTMHTDYVHVNT
jgi:hypothetical protein